MEACLETAIASPESGLRLDVAERPPNGFAVLWSNPALGCIDEFEKPVFEVSERSRVVVKPKKAATSALPLKANPRCLDDGKRGLWAKVCRTFGVNKTGANVRRPKTRQLSGSTFDDVPGCVNRSGNISFVVNYLVGPFYLGHA